MNLNSRFFEFVFANRILLYGLPFKSCYFCELFKIHIKKAQNNKNLFVILNFAQQSEVSQNPCHTDLSCYTCKFCHTERSEVSTNLNIFKVWIFHLKFKVCLKFLWIFRFLAKAQNDNVDFCLFTKNSKRQAHKFSSKLKPTKNSTQKALALKAIYRFFALLSRLCSLR